MSLINYTLVKEFFTNNQVKLKDKNDEVYTEYRPIKYRWTHGDISIPTWEMVY